MYIKSVKWLDEENQEAEVTISDGSINILCFSHPFKKNVNDILVEPIYCLDVENIVLANEQIVYAKKINNTFKYSICGKFIEKASNTVLLGNIKLCLEDAHIPAEISITLQHDNGCLLTQMAPLTLHLN